MKSGDDVVIFAQVGQGNESIIFQVIYLASFMFFVFYGQKLQTFIMLREIGNAVNRLKSLKEKARQIAITSVKDAGKGDIDPTPRIDHLLEYFTIMPSSLDPSGIVPKINHLIDVHDMRFENEVKLIAPEADSAQSNNINGVLRHTIGTNAIFRFVRHWYLLGKKTMSLYVIMQVQMQLPLIMQLAEALTKSVKAFADGQPVGDGAGALAAAKMMYKYEKRKIAKDVVVAEMSFEKRKVFILKSEGPGATVGKPSDAIKKLVEENKQKIAAIIMIDAAGKYEGEKSGETSEGAGAAIGGIGVEGFVIEEITSKHKIPVHAVIVKESLEEAYTSMTKAIHDGVDVAVARVKRLITEFSKEGDTIIVAGIGNTVGIGQ
jgi:hypothetical protein